jgi:Recombination endonuclease VII
MKRLPHAGLTGLAYELYITRRRSYWHNLSPEKKRSYIARSAEWRKNNREKMKKSYRKHDLKRHYGLTLEQYNTMFTAQGYKCAACGSSEPGRKTGEWAIDHCHTTETVRGILCHGCNVALGQVKDDIRRLKALVSYLERGPAKCQH